MMLIQNEDTKHLSLLDVNIMKEIKS